MDGVFVEKNNLELMRDYATTLSHITLIEQDIHLMVENVEEIMDDYLDLGQNQITFHIEAMHGDKERTLQIISDIKANGNKVGLAINPDTSIDEIKPYLEYIHTALIMTVVPGKGGQKLIPETLDKIKELKDYISSNSIEVNIEADGGINADTCKAVRDNGCDILVSGMYIISNNDLKFAVDTIRG